MTLVLTRNERQLAMELARQIDGTTGTAQIGRIAIRFVGVTLVLLAISTKCLYADVPRVESREVPEFMLALHVQKPCTSGYEAPLNNKNPSVYITFEWVCERRLA